MRAHPHRLCLLLLMVALAGCRSDPKGSPAPSPPAPADPAQPSADSGDPQPSAPDRDEPSDPNVDVAPLPDTPLPSLQPHVPSPATGTTCPDGFVLLPGGSDVLLGELDEERARSCACDPLLLRAATFSSIPPVCMDRHPFPGAGQPWPSDRLFASTRFSLIEDLRHLLPRWGRRLCTYSENLLAAAGPTNQRFVGSDEWRGGRCVADHQEPSGTIGDHPTCQNAHGVRDLNVRSEWLILDDVAAGVLAAQAYPRIAGGMLALSTANTGQGGNSAAANNYGFHFHVYPWGFFDVGDPPGEGFIDDGVRFCADPGVEVPGAREAELTSLRDRYVATGDWSALWAAPASHPTSELTGWTDVAAGRNHSCGLRAGRPVCWGSDHWGESSPPDRPLRSISVGWRHSCGLTEHGEAVCWGDDSTGQGTPPDLRFASIGAGDFFTCGLTTEGRAVCWGNTSRDSWELPPDDRTFQHVAVGDRNGCGISDGEVLCWGETRWPRGQPPGGVSFTSLELGYEEACGILTETGAVSCWGNLDRIPSSIPERLGQRAVSSGARVRCTLTSDGRADCLDDLKRPELAPPADARFTSLSVGYAHACGVTAEGGLRCFGGDSFGQASPP